MTSPDTPIVDNLSRLTVLGAAGAWGVWIAPGVAWAEDCPICDGPDGPDFDED